MGSIIDTLVTDRTKADETRAVELTLKVGKNEATPEEVAEFLSPMKGAYRIDVDLNRVGEAMKYLMGRFNRYGYAVTVTSRTDWVITDTPRQSEMNTYIRDIKALRGTFEVLQSTPPAPGTAEKLTWKTANDIEQILKDIETVIQRIEVSFPRSGSFMFYSGNRPLPV